MSNAHRAARARRLGRRCTASLSRSVGSRRRAVGPPRRPPGPALSPTSTPRRRGPCTTATRSGTGVDTSGVTFSPPNLGLDLPGPRRPGLRRAARGHGAGIRGDGERHGLRAGGRQRVPSCGRPTSGRRCPRATFPAATSARRWASPAPRSSTRRAARSSPWPTSWSNGAPAHFLVGLNIYSGAIELDEAVDPPGQDDRRAILQRTGLNLERRQRRLRLRRQRRATARPTAAGSSRYPKAAGRRATTRRCPSATTGPSGWAAPRPRSTPPATSGWPPATARRRRPTTSATRCSSCRRRSPARSTSPRRRGRTTTRNDLDLGSTRAGAALERDGPAGRQVVRPPTC